MKALASLLARFAGADEREGNWRPGDLAVCVRDGWLVPDTENPKEGDLLRVTSVVEAFVFGALRSGLRLEGKPADRAWESRAFQKAVADNQPAEAAFSALIKNPGERRPDAPLPIPSDAPAVAPAGAGVIVRGADPRSGRPDPGPGDPQP